MAYMRTGETVLLIWNGYPHVPLYLAGVHAEVVKGPYFRRGLLYYRVRLHDGEVRTVRADQVLPATKKEK